jgi:hypothetical protein
MFDGAAASLPFSGFFLNRALSGALNTSGKNGNGPG